MLIGTKRALLGAALVLSGSFLLRGSAALFNVSKVITGSAGLNKFGASTVNLSAVNTFTGAISINAGTLALTGSGSLGSGTFSGNILNNGILIRGSTANQTLSGIISGTGSLQQTAFSTTTLLGVNTFSGGITIAGSGGAVAASTDVSTGTGNIVLNGGILRCTATGYTFGATKTITIGASGGTIDNTTGTFNKAVILATNGQLLGSGTLTITAGTSGTDSLSIRAYQNLFSGNVTITTGRLEITTTDPGTGGNNLIGTGSITITSGTLAFGADAGSTGSNTLPNNITCRGTGDATGCIHSKSTGTTTFNGTVTLTAAATVGNDQAGGGYMIFNNVISGGFTLTVATLVEFNAVNTFTGLTMGSGKTLRGVGTIPTVSIPNVASSVLQPGNGSGTVGTLTVGGNLTFAGSTSALAITSDNVTSANVSVTGTCALGACKVNLLDTMPAGVFNLIVASGVMSGTLPTINTNSSGRTPTLAQIGNTLQLTLV